MILWGVRIHYSKLMMHLHIFNFDGNITFYLLLIILGLILFSMPISNMLNPVQEQQVILTQNNNNRTPRNVNMVFEVIRGQANYDFFIFDKNNPSDSGPIRNLIHRGNGIRTIESRIANTPQTNTLANSVVFYSVSKSIISTHYKETMELKLRVNIEQLNNNNYIFTTKNRPIEVVGNSDFIIIKHSTFPDNINQNNIASSSNQNNN